MKKLLLGDITTFLARGTAPKYTDDESFYVLNQKCIRDWRVSLGDVRFTDNTSKKVHSDRILQDGDILVNSTGKGTLGRVAQFSKFDKKATVDSHITIVRPNQDIVDAGYLGYVLKSRQNQIEMMAEGSTGQTELSKAKLSNMTIDLPDINKQKKIADILGSLDEKIELNRRMNETLEQIGQALFRHYFIDNPDVKNWKIGTIDDLGDVTTGKTPSKKIHEYFGKDMPFLKVPDMHNKSVVIDTNDGLSNLGVESQKNKTITKYSTCVSCIATVGVVSLSGVDLQTNQQINSIIPRQKYYRFYNYYAMKHKSDYIKTLASSGSAAPNLNRGQFAKISVALPPDEVLKSFDEMVKPVFEQIIESTYQIDGLIRLRDSLLPKLISGEISV